MPENQILTPPHQAEDEISLLDLLIVLAKHKKMIMGVTFVTALLAVGASLLMPNFYTGTAKILPPQQSQSTASALLGQITGGLAGGAASVLGFKNPNDLYVAMLKSRTLMEKVAKRFDLQKRNEQKTMMGPLNVQDGASKITSGNDGIITIEVDAKDPKLAADMANAFIEELAKLMQTLALTEAAQRRAFFEKQMKPAKDKLTDAEVILDKTPKTSLQYIDALRNLKYQEAVYEILAKQYEMAKLDEAKDSPFIQVLDKAKPPEEKSKPQRALIVILATLISFFAAVMCAFIREAMDRAKSDPAQAERLALFRRFLRG